MLTENKYVTGWQLPWLNSQSKKQTGLFITNRQGTELPL